MNEHESNYVTYGYWCYWAALLNLRLMLAPQFTVSCLGKSSINGGFNEKLMYKCGISLAKSCRLLSCVFFFHFPNGKSTGNRESRKGSGCFWLGGLTESKSKAAVSLLFGLKSKSLQTDPPVCKLQAHKFLMFLHFPNPGKKKRSSGGSYKNSEERSFLVSIGRRHRGPHCLQCSDQRLWEMQRVAVRLALVSGSSGATHEFGCDHLQCRHWKKSTCFFDLCVF